VAFQVAALVERVQSLPKQQDSHDGRGRERDLVNRLQRLVWEANLDDIKRRDAQGRRLVLEAHLQSVRNGVTDLSEALTARYLSHSTLSRLKSI
jgi:uncharacterized alpha-E superfamily protein